MATPDLFPGGLFENFRKKETHDGMSHAALRERLRKTLHYGSMPTFDRPSLPMTEIAVELFKEAAPRELGRLDIRWAANISRKAVVSPCALMLAMIYIERLRHRDPHYLQHVSSSDLFLISMMLASKYLYDEGVEEAVFNEEWAESADLDVSDINALESDFLMAMDWKLFVRADEFWVKLLDMEKRVCLREWLKTDHLTYTDAHVLTSDVTWHPLLCSLLKTLAEVWLACGVAYVMGAVTLLTTPTSLSLVHSTLGHTSSALTPPTSRVTPAIDQQMTNDSLIDSLTPPTHSKTPPPNLLTPPIDPINPIQSSRQSTTSDPVVNQTSSLLSHHLLSLSLLTDTMFAFVLGKTENERDLNTACDKCTENTRCEGTGSCGFASRCLRCRLQAPPISEEPSKQEPWRDVAAIRTGQCTVNIQSNLVSKLVNTFAGIQLGSQTTSAG